MSEDRSRIDSAHEIVEPIHVYLAADFGLRNEATLLANALTATQPRIRIVSRWHSAPTVDEITAAELGPRASWDDERALDVATRNTEDIERCDSLVLLTTGEASRGGRHFETGYAVALGKPVLVVGPLEHAFQHSPGIRHADSHDPAEIAEAICSAARPRMRPSALTDVYVIVRRHDDVLLLLRSGTGYKDNEWGPPSGKVEPGETFSQAAARELAEETGISVEPIELKFLHTIERVPNTGSHWVGTFFEVRVANVQPVNREPGKHSAISYFPSSALPPNTVDYVRHALDAAARGEFYTEWNYPDAEDTT